MKPTTLCFPQNKDGKFLLGMKKRGFGAGKYNGFGGKIDDGESFRDCAVRELFEEVSLLAQPADLECVAWLDFQFPYEPALSHIGYVYVLRKFGGMPLESEEMRPRWFALEDFPFAEMWAGDQTWVPPVLTGKKLRGTIVFGEDGETVTDMKLEEVDDIIEE